MRLTAALLSVLSTVAMAQLTSHSNTSSPQQGFADADLIIIGDIAGGTAVDTGSAVRCRVLVQPDRVLKGEASGQITAVWEYTPGPMEPPQVTTRIPKLHGMWALKRAGQAEYRPIRIGRMPGGMGGFCLGLPEVQSLGEFAYNADAPAEAKVARELAAALQQIAAEQGEKLNPERRSDALGATSMRVSPAQMLFQEIAMALDGLERGGDSGVARILANSPLPNVRVLGLAGLMRHGDIDAVLAVERDIRTLAPTLESRALHTAISSIPKVDDPRLIEALGRLALSDVEVPALDSVVAFRLSGAASANTLPYLAAMLENPNPGIRSAAVMGFCNALHAPYGKDAELKAAWRPEMEPVCPNRAPIPDPELESKCVQFWKSWWERERTQNARLASPPVVNPPARYRSERPPIAEPVSIPMEERFGAFLRWCIAFQEPAPNGSLPAWRTPLGSRISKADDAVLDRLVHQTSDELEAQDRKVRELINAYRVQSRMPPAEEMRNANEERRRILTERYQEALSQLSPQGRSALEQALRDIAVAGARVRGPQ